MVSIISHRAIKFPCIFFLTVLFVGCASSYVAPSGQEPSASISFEVAGDPIFGYVASFFYFEESDERSCGSSLKRMAKINKGNPLAGKSTNTEEILIPAGRTVVIRSIFSPASAFSQRSCKADSFLNAEADKSYALRVKWLANQCEFDFYDVTSGESVPITVKSEPSGC